MKNRRIEPHSPAQFVSLPQTTVSPSSAATSTISASQTAGIAWVLARAGLWGSVLALALPPLAWAQSSPAAVAAGEAKGVVLVQPPSLPLAAPVAASEVKEEDKSATACVPKSAADKADTMAQTNPVKCAPPTPRRATARAEPVLANTAKAVPLGRPAKAAARPDAIISYTFHPGRVYTVPTGLGIATQIVLHPAEKIRDFGTGFSSGWDIVRRDNVIYLKPKDPDAETNMYIRTEQRSYLLDLKIVSKDWIKIDEARAQGVAYVVQFNYPEVTAAPSSQPLPRGADTAADPAAPERSPYLSFHTDYEAASEAGAKWLTPLRVYDDGVVTYVQMPSTAQVPAFFGRQNDRGEEFLLNRSMDRGRHVLHGVYPFIIIRHGTDVVAVRRR